jgi:gas vesicle protein
MKAQELNEKMKNAYQNMVEVIETLVDTEGKTLKEAVEIAEEKLSDWQELSREESQKISAEVQSDL